MNFTASDHEGIAKAFGMAAILPISWSTIWTWIITYGLPLVLQVLNILLPLLNGGATPSLQKIITYAESVFAALQAGQAVPVWVP